MNRSREKWVPDLAIAGVCGAMLKQEGAAAAAFEARWTLTALKAVDPELHDALKAQEEAFHDALTIGRGSLIISHGEALCRGWLAAMRAMEASGVADDAYHIGEFGGVRVAIGRQQAMPEHLRDRYGSDLVWLTPRSVAAMYSHYRLAMDLQKIWPDAEIVDIREKDVRLVATLD